MKKEKILSVIKTASSKLPTKYGKFNLSIYQSKPDNKEHIVLEMGKIKKGDTVLVRVHSQCLTADALLSLRCDCRGQLHKAMKIISKGNTGLIFYLNQEGRDIGLTNKIKAYALQDKGQDTVEANLLLGLPEDARSYDVVVKILKKLGISSINLLTNNPDKVVQLEKNGVRINTIIPLETKPNKNNSFYLKTKKKKMGHRLRHCRPIQF